MDGPSKEKAREKVTETSKNGHCVVPQVWCHRPFILHLTQAMAIREHIGYPDHILEERNQKLDQEYAHVRKSRLLLPFLLLEVEGVHRLVTCLF